MTSATKSQLPPNWVLKDDLYEEDAEDYLHDHSIPLCSHSRFNIYCLAWENGWRPVPSWGALHD